MWPDRWKKSVLLRLFVAGMVIGLAGWQLSRAQDAPQTSPPPTTSTGKLDLSKSGVYRNDPWEYRFTITNPGTRSEGTLGELFYAGKPVEEPALADFYRTPWGDLHWVGNPVLAWKAHGWMPRPQDAKEGKQLAEPPLASGAPVVMMLVLREGDPADKPVALPPWLQEEMTKLGVKSLRVERPWSLLNDQAVTVHDTKMIGTLLARLAPARHAESFDIILDGTAAATVPLPRRDGTTKLIRHTLRQTVQEEHFYLAFRVDRAAAAWPKPFDVGPEDNGKVLPVKAAREVVIALPGDKVSGGVWAIKSIQGDGITDASVKPGGQPQFTPASEPGAARKGVFENTLRVLRTGKSTVELEFKRPWQSDKPPEKTFTVTLDILEVSSVPSETSNR